MGGGACCDVRLMLVSWLFIDSNGVDYQLAVR